MDWLTKITNWLRQQVERVWNAFSGFIEDMVVKLVTAILDLAATAIEAIPVPDFISEYSIGSLLSQAGSTIAWIVGTFRIGEGLTIIAAGYAFRLLRKLFTLGQW